MSNFGVQCGSSFFSSRKPVAQVPAQRRPARGESTRNPLDKIYPATSSKQEFMSQILWLSMIISFVIWQGWRAYTKRVIAVIGFQSWYRYQYMFMPSWWLAKKIKFFLSGRRCHNCGTRFRIDVHHRYYRILGNVSVLYFEWLMPWILQVLCRSCHDEEHG